MWYFVQSTTKERELIQIFYYDHNLITNIMAVDLVKHNPTSDMLDVCHIWKPQ